MKAPISAADPAVSVTDRPQGPGALMRVAGNPLVRAGLVLGMGFGGLADGIVLHSILGWHHLICVSATVFCQPTSIEQLQLENTQDGYFDLALWIVLVVGTALLFRAAHGANGAWSRRVFLGSLFAGGGLFNFLEGLVDHQILGIHHVLPGSPHQLMFDMLYLGNGLMFIAIGLGLILSSSQNSLRRP